MLTLTVHAKPGASRSELVGDDGAFTAFVRSPPEGGKANGATHALVVCGCN